MDKPKGLKETNTFIVYTPGKVGSSTVINALTSVGLKAHRCYPGNIKDYHYRDAPTITMMRDPIAWAISFLWENGMNIVIDSGFGTIDIHLKHIKKIINDDILNWFDKHYRPITGINVYGQVFPKTIGYKIYSIRGLVLNTHKLSENLAEALCEFLPIYTNHEFKPEDFKIEHRAHGADKFGPEYEEFVNNVKFPLSFLNEVYNTEYCKHFFLRTDRQEWVRKWME